MFCFKITRSGNYECFIHIFICFRTFLFDSLIKLSRLHFQDFIAGLLSSNADIGGAAGSNALQKEEKSSIKPSAQNHGYGSSTRPPPSIQTPPVSRPNGTVKSYHDDSDVVSVLLFLPRPVLM